MKGGTGPIDKPCTHRRSLAKHRRIPFTRLAHETFIAREEGSGTRMTVERVFAEHGVRFRVRMELGSNEAIKQAVAGGLGLSVLSQNTFGDPAAEDLEVLDVTDFPVRRSWYIVWPRGQQLSVVAATFVDFLHRHVALLKPRA
ncbi:LysR substrate-binding domain-containing protein [Thioalkalivibrio sp.]|uniref:LysR substrate-binding domain-containing protein n=1 Tax=Thioalkalivibrio sp. TaxID=2093813 RepID=UPI0039771C4E